MTLITGQVADVGMNNASGAFYARAAEFRGDGTTVVSPSPATFTITGGVVSAEVEPGPTIITLHVGPIRKDWFVNVPETDVGLGDLIATYTTYEPAVVSAAIKARDAAIEAESEAKQAAIDAEAKRVAAETAADLTGADRLHVDNVRALLDETYDQSQAGMTLPPRLTETALNDTYGFKGVQQVAPTLHTYEANAQVQRRALTLTKTGTVYTVNNTTMRVQKSDDFGTTWADRGDIPFQVYVMARSHVSGTLIAIEDARPCRIARSTDDGQTWTILGFTFNHPPLEEQGILCTTSGHWLVGEYGPQAPYAYRIMRSTDDGLTFASVYASSGTEPAGDPGHIHSITYDHVANCLVAFSDRPAWPRPEGTSGPYLLRSDDEGATWQIIGEAKNEWDPNFVAPMYFDNYIAWGYDNHRNGVISRMARADFYSGNWTRATIEDVAQLNNKVFYSTFPMRDGVWAIAQAAETVGEPKDPGSFAQEVHLVSQDGAVVSGGFQFHGPTQSRTSMASTRTRFPTYELGALDHGKFAWANVYMGYPYNQGAIPVTVGVGPTLPNLDSGPLVPPVMVGGSAIRARVADGSLKKIFEFDTYDQVVIANTASTAANPVKAVLTKLGNWDIYSGLTLLASFSTGGVTLRSGQTRIGEGSGPAIFAYNSGDPNGTLSGRKSSLAFDAIGSDYGPLWVKVAGGDGNTGWARVAILASGATSARPTSRPVGQQFFDTTLGKPVWWNGTAWVDATGTAA